MPLSEGALPARCDVAIVGAGFTGLSAALALARAGRDVLVLDAGDPGFGASSRNGGMIGSGHRVGFAALTQRYGETNARAIVEEGLASLEFTVDLIEREQIRCHFVRCGRFRGAWTPAAYEAYAREAEFMGKEFGVEADVVTRAEQHKEIATEAYHGGVVLHRHGGLHPALLHQGLLERARSAGATVRGQRPVGGIARENNGFRLTTTDGDVSATEVIVATNGYTGTESPDFRRRLVPVPSFIIATEELGEARVKELIPGARMIVESRARHCYYRPSPDGKRLLFGGRAALTPLDPRRGAAILHRLMIDIFPELADVGVTHSWSGFVAFSRDHLPHVGVRDGVHYALGYSGSGVAMAPYLGWKAAQKVLGRPEGESPFDATDFAPIPLRWGLPLGLRALGAWHRFKDWREGSH